MTVAKIGRSIPFRKHRFNPILVSSAFCAIASWISIMLFLCEGNDIHERQVDGVTVSQINEAGFFVSQDKAEQHQVVPQQTTYFAQPVPLYWCVKRACHRFLRHNSTGRKTSNPEPQTEPGKSVVVIMHSAMHSDVIDKIYLHDIFL